MMAKLAMLSVLLMAALLSSCGIPVSTRSLTASRVDAAPTGEPLGLTAPENFGPGPFVRLEFASNPDLAALARRPGMLLHYEFFACNAQDQYIDVGPIFAEGEGRYAVYVPARASELTFWVSSSEHRQIGHGWPPELANEPLCFQIGGGRPYESVIWHRPLRLDSSVGRLMNFEEPDAL